MPTLFECLQHSFLQVSGNYCAVAHLLPELFLGLGSSVSGVVYIVLDSVKSELASI